MAEQPPANIGPTSSSPLDGAPPHKPADDREEIYFNGSPLLRADVGRMALAALVAAVFIAVPIMAHRYWPGKMPFWAGALSVLIGLGSLAVPLLIVKATRYRITNYRIDFERGLLSKKIDTLELWHVEDLQFRQSLLDRILNVGTIIVLSHDETTPKLALEGLPDPRPVYESLKQRVIAVKRQRGVIKMDTGG